MKLKKIQKLALIFLVIAVFLQLSANAKNEWLQVRSKNFNLIGNASEKEIRGVATKLEQFREMFRQLFTRTNLNSPIPTNVLVFKNDSSYKPFKPKRADGKIDTQIAGYFQSGEDVNYITLSAGGADAETYGTIFHEYVHFIMDTNFGKSEIPPWFNEGLAEYYQTFEIEDDSKVKLGLLQNAHLHLLQQNKLIPLETLFKISNYALHQNANHSRSIFYAQSWALIHYFLQSGKSESLGKFVDLAIKDLPSEQAFQDAFGMNYEQMEKELKKYVAKNTYKYSMVSFEKKLLFDSEMQTTPLSEALTNAYLGDLLYHTNRADDAEEYLQKALKLQPDLSMANTTFGMVRIRQRKFDEAKVYLEKAISGDLKNHLAFYNYAYLLSRETRNEYGFVSSFPEESAAKMREMLKKAIAINPEFTESYELLAFVSLVNNEELDEAIGYLEKALKFQPGNQKYALRIAEIRLRQEKFEESSAIAVKIAATADDQEVKSRAESLLGQIQQFQEITAKNEKARKEFEDAVANAGKDGGRPVLITRGRSGKTLTPEEAALLQENEEIRSTNLALKPPAEGEQRILGSIQKIQCKGKVVTYTIKTGAETLFLSSNGFQGITLVAFTMEASDVQVGCGADVSTLRSVLTYKSREPGKDGVVGELVAIDFVPGNFRFMDASELTEPEEVSGEGGAINATGKPADVDARMREEMEKALKNAMRKPEPGEKREIGRLEKIECNNKGQFFYMKTDSQTFKFSAIPQKLQIRGFTAEIEQVEFGCGLKSLDVPAVFTYIEDPKGKDKTNGEIVSIEFVPKSFTLDK